MLRVKDIRVVGMGDCGTRRLLPTQAGDEPLASRSLRPRYIFLPPRGLKFFESRYQHGAMVRGSLTPHAWIPASAGIAVALRRPHMGMKMVGRRALAWGQASALRGSPSPQPSPIEGEGETAPRRWGPSIPDRSPGHAFIAIAHAGRRWHAKA